MANRTNTDAVKKLLEPGKDYNGYTDLTPFIQSASAVVNRVVALAAQARQITVAASDAELIERWLAAHFYCQSDKPYQTRTTAGASAGFVGQTKIGLESTLYGQTAIRMDPSGVLDAIDKKKFAGASWLGKIESEWLKPCERTDGT